jgi:hypothetical protein
MQDESAEMLDSNLLNDAEATSQHVAVAPSGDELMTMRLPPATPPPPAMHFATTSTQPLPASFPQPARVPVVDGGAHYRSAPPAASRPTWLRALLDSTFPPPTATPDPSARRMARRTAGAVCVGLALAFALVAMITGLRGAPDDPAMAPTVAAALVIARALVAVGSGAFSFGLLRMAERLLGD